MTLFTLGFVSCFSTHFFRPADVETLLGDATKAKQQVGWFFQVKFKDLVHKMVEADLQWPSKF